jgi:hypothetical protein
MAAQYTQQETERLLKAWAEGVPVIELAIRFNRPSKSVIAKLSKEGVYQKKGYLDKLGQLPESKLEICREITSILGIETLIGLDKCPKAVLKKLRASVKDLSECFEQTLEELAGTSENLSILQEHVPVRELQYIHASEQDAKDLREYTYKKGDNNGRI